MSKSMEEKLEIKKTDSKFIIEINNNFIANSSRSEVQEMINLAISPLFLTFKPNITKVKRSIASNQNLIGKIAIFMEVSNAFTGGRYSIVHQAVLLGDYFNVDIVTNRKIDYLLDNFASYSGFNNVNVIIDDNYLVNKIDNDYEFVIGLPNISAQYASLYCNKFNIPFIVMAFETPNFISTYRGGIDSSEEFWSNFKKVAETATLRISPSKLSSKFFREWLSIADENFNVIKPCMNVNVAKEILGNNIKYREYQNDYVMTTRIVSFKNPIDVLKILERKGIKLRLHHIGTISDANFDFSKFKYIELVKHGNVSDHEKFKIINSCKALIHPSKFEGFGMPPMEALFFNKPVLAYKLPVLKELYGDTLIYAKDENEFARNIITLEKEEIIPTKFTKNPSFVYPENCTNDLLTMLEKHKTNNIIAGILAFNCNDYIDTVIRSIYESVDKIIIVEGCVNGNECNATKDYHSIDGTFEYLTGNDIYDPENKIKIFLRSNRPWHDKVEMQNKIASTFQDNDIYIKVDADEVWDIENLNKVINYLKVNANIDIIRMTFLHFWTSFNIIARDAGGKWKTKHQRVWRVRKGFHHLNSFNYFIDKNGNIVSESNYREFIWNLKPIYHFGYARESKYVDQKLKYYKHRGIENHVDVNIYNKWKKLTDKTQPTQTVRSWAEEYDKNLLPDIMKWHKYYNVSDIRKFDDEK